MTSSATGTSTGPCPDVHAAVTALAATHPRLPYLLYAMGLWLRTLDTRALEVDNLLDGPDDKKVDFFHIDTDTGVATIAQGFESPDWAKSAAPANKASDLNTAVPWLLESDLKDIPRPAIRAAAEELRDRLSDGTVRRVDVVYVHNLPRSKQIDDELATVERALNALLAKYSGLDPAPTGRAIQLDIHGVDARRRSLHDTIAITDNVTISSVTTPVELTGPEWRALTGTASADGLVAWYQNHGDDLFNANIRDFLGSRDTARNINSQIRRSAVEESDNFWIFNNGITILTNALSVSGNDISLSGVSIINGAQTTGSLAQAAVSGSVSGSQVQFRVIECRNPDLIASIIKYNNLQNPVTAWDRRAIDPVQLRLQDEFAKIGQTYQVRRGEGRRKATDVHLDKLGPYLTAFHGDPIAATNKSEVFETEGRYRAAFKDGAEALNLLFVYRLGEAVATAKLHLRGQVEAGGPEGAKAEETYRFFRYGSFSHVVVMAAARILGVWLEGRDSNYMDKVALSPDPSKHLDEWDASLLTLVEDVVLPAVRTHLAGVPEDEIYSRLKTQQGVEAITTGARGLIEQVAGLKPDTYSAITDELILV